MRQPSRLLRSHIREDTYTCEWTDGRERCASDKMVLSPISINLLIASLVYHMYYVYSKRFRWFSKSKQTVKIFFFIRKHASSPRDTP